MTSRIGSKSSRKKGIVSYMAVANNVPVNACNIGPMIMRATSFSISSSTMAPTFSLRFTPPTPMEPMR
jgi:hypothetical protein